MIRPAFVISSVLVGALLAGCDEPHGLVLPEEFVGETRDLQVYRDPSGVEVCGGTLATWQAHVERIGDFFGSTGPFGPSAVVLIDPSENLRYCNLSDLDGCADVRTSPPVAVGSPRSIPHELAHLMASGQTGRAKIPFWNEGFAAAWSDRGSELPSAAALDDLFADSFREIHYRSASHWVQWIADAYGPERVAEFLRVSEVKDSESERLEQFEKVLGEPYAAVQERFWAEAPLYYPGFGRCGATDHVLPAQGRLDLAVTLDCAVDPGPVPAWPGGQVYTTRVIELAGSGSYSIHADQGDTMLLPCDATSDPVDALRWSAYERAIYFEGTKAVPSRLGLRAGRYKLWLVATDATPIDMKVVILPTVPLTRIVP